METKSIEVEVLESNPDFIKVKIPFLDIPIKMTQRFFRPRVGKGYFKIKQQPENL